MVVALTLPERLAAARQQQVRAPGGGGLQRVEKLGHTHLWCQQQVNMIRHNNPGMQLIVP
jgi:hypothetical protein